MGGSWLMLFIPPVCEINIHSEQCKMWYVSTSASASFSQLPWNFEATSFKTSIKINASFSIGVGWCALYSNVPIAPCEITNQQQHFCHLSSCRSGYHKSSAKIHKICPKFLNLMVLYRAFYLREYCALRS